MRLSCTDSHCASARITPILAGSSGWKESGPSASQRRAPFSSRPSGVSVAASSSTQPSHTSIPERRIHSRGRRDISRAAATPSARPASCRPRYTAEEP